MLKFVAPAETKTLNWTPNRAARSAQVKRVHQAVYKVLHDLTRPEYTTVYIQITRAGPRNLDSDNLVGACKPVRDAIARWLGVDDASPRLTWSYDQRLELVEDETPRARSKHRTWVEVAMGPEPIPTTPAPAPPRLEREKKVAPVLDGQSSTTLISEVPLGTRGLRLGTMSHEGTTYYRLCLHYPAQGHLWRTQGVRIDPGEVQDLIEALKKV